MSAGPFFVLFEQHFEPSPLFVEICSWSIKKHGVLSRFYGFPGYNIIPEGGQTITQPQITISVSIKDVSEIVFTNLQNRVML